MSTTTSRARIRAVPSKRDNRMEVLEAGRRGGWSHEMGSFDSGNIIVDAFTNEVGIVRVVWLRTPWKDSGKFAGAIFSERAARSDHNVWSLRGNRGLVP